METMEISPGAIIEYLYANEIHIGCVISTEKHITIVTPTNRLTRLSKSRFLPWQGPCLSSSLSRDAIIHEMEEIDSLRDKIKKEIDTRQIWSLVKEEMERCDIFWLSELLWQETDIHKTAALGRALLEDKLHFKFQNPYFKIFTPAIVENKLRVLTQKEREEKLLKEGRSFLKKLWEVRTKGGDIPPVDQDIEKGLKELLKKGIISPDNRSFQRKWKKLTDGIPQDPHLPLLLAQTWKMLPRHYNYLLDQADYKWGDEWSKAYIEEIKRQEQAFKNNRHLTLSLPFISIDSPTTQDIDDAFFIEETSKGNYLLHLALACPVLYWDFSSSLAKEVAKRSSSLYLPEGTSHMLPERLGTGIFSLHQGEEKPAIVLKTLLSSKGDLLDFSFSFEWITIEKNLSYTEAEEILQRRKGHILHSALSLAQLLRKKRIEKGAVIIERQEPRITITPQGEDVQICLEEPEVYPLSQLIISEFMILANTLSARWTNNSSLPLLFRTQDIELPVEAKGVWRDPVKIYGIIKLLSATSIDTTIRPHASLGVEGYAPITSPLRRYIDFLNISQIYKTLIQETPFSKEELDTLIPFLNMRLQETNKIQKYRLRYWKLLYLKRYCKKFWWKAIVVDEEPQHYIFLLPREQILFKAPKNFITCNIFPGKNFRIRFQRIDPLNNQIKINKIEED